MPTPIKKYLIVEISGSPDRAARYLEIMAIQFRNVAQAMNLMARGVGRQKDPADVLPVLTLRSADELDTTETTVIVL